MGVARWARLKPWPEDDACTNRKRAAPSKLHPVGMIWAGLRIDLIDISRACELAVPTTLRHRYRRCVARSQSSNLAGVRQPRREQSKCVHVQTTLCCMQHGIRSQVTKEVAQAFTMAFR